MDLEFDFDDHAALRRLDAIADRLESSRLLEQLAPAMQEYEADLFATGGHGEWAPNAPGTVENKGSSQVLVNTGALMADLTGSRPATDGDTLVLGTSRPYAGYLKAGARGMPRRDPTPAPDGRTVETWGSHLLKYAVDGHQV